MKHLSLILEPRLGSPHKQACCEPKPSVARCNPGKRRQLTCKINEFLSQFSETTMMKKSMIFTLPAKTLAHPTFQL